MKMWCVGVLALVVFARSTAVAQVLGTNYFDGLGVNISSGDSDDIDPATWAGHIPQRKWNNARGGSTFTTTVTHRGTSVPALTCALALGWNDQANAPYWDSYTGTGSTDLTKTGWNSDLYGGNGDGIMTVGGIPFNSYDVAVLEGGHGSLGNMPNWNLYVGQSGTSYTRAHGNGGGAIYAMQILSLDPIGDGGALLLVR